MQDVPALKDGLLPPVIKDYRCFAVETFKPKR